MKKILALALSVLMILSLAACGEPADTTETPDTSTEAPETPETPAANVIAPTVEDGTWGAAFWADFQSALAANPDADSETIANALLSSESGMAMGGAMAAPTVEGYQQGFAADITGFKNGTMFAPFAAGYAFMGYVFELEEGADVKAFVQTLNDNCDLRWMVCMTADMSTIGAVDNYVLAILSPAAMPGVEGGEAQVIAPELVEGSKAEALWNDFLAYMDINGSFSLATDVADYLAGNEVLGADVATEALDEMTEIEGFSWAIEGYNNAAMLEASGISVYVFQIDQGMMPDAWGEWNLGSNIPEGANAVWGAHGVTLILIIEA